MEIRKWKRKREIKIEGARKCGSSGKRQERTAALQVAVEENESYFLLGDSPVTMGKFARRLQSSQDPSYIFAS
jgi:hypothetical protein